MANVVKEHFTSIHQMLTVINNRPNNSVMDGKRSSITNDKGFTGTRDWEEANELFEHGYVDVLDKIKAGVAAGIKKTEVIQKRRVSNGVVGYAPNVPNAIMGLPNSMIYMEKTPQKIKAVSIVYNICDNCMTEAQEFIDSGVAVLNVINRLELNGCRVNLKIMYFCANEGSDYAFGSVDVKNYREHMDLQKLCFPVAHPSMFRRFGFKWLETCNGLKERRWSSGYGHSIHGGADHSVIKEQLQENEFYIDLKITKKHNYDADEIIESMNLK